MSSDGLLSGPALTGEGFPDLMPTMVRDILLVSSLYDSFILEEDGRFADKLFSQYLELNLRSPPRIIGASTGQEGLKLLKQRAFDLVILMPRIPDMSTEALARQIREHSPRLPVVRLTFDATEQIGRSAEATAELSKYAPLGCVFSLRGDR